jgi:hypothetical protein
MGILFVVVRIHCNRNIRGLISYILEHKSLCNFYIFPLKNIAMIAQCYYQAVTQHAGVDNNIITFKKNK